MIRDICAFATMALFIATVGLILPDLADMIHRTDSAIVRHAERN
jgi:hypothetical protein